MRLPELEKGDRGRQVQMVQHLLNTNKSIREPLDLDGVFGSRTDRAVRRYQGSHSLEIDGVVGSKTWRSLGVADRAAPTPRPAAAGASTPTRNVSIPASRAAGTPGARFAIQPPRQTASPASASPASAPPAPAPRRIGPMAHQPRTAIEAPWMRIAIAEMWVREVAGRGNNPRIMEYHAATSLGQQPDSVPWCASFVNWCLAQVNVRGSNSAAAASFRRWGRELDTPRYGCIIQLHRAPAGHDRSTGSSSGNHVGFFVRQTATHITLLGGNQSDQVKESSFRLSSYRIEATRWPS